MLFSMTQTRRRAKGSAKDLPAIYAQVSPEAKSVLAAISVALDRNQAQALDDVLRALPVDDDGVPTFMDRSQYHRREELPIPAA